MSVNQPKNNFVWPTIGSMLKGRGFCDCQTGLHQIIYIAVLGRFWFPAAMPLKKMVRNCCCHRSTSTVAAGRSQLPYNQEAQVCTWRVQPGHNRNSSDFKWMFPADKYLSTMATGQVSVPVQAINTSSPFLSWPVLLCWIYGSWPLWN